MDARAKTAAEVASGVLEGVKQRASAGRDWAGRLGHELALLPETLQRFREGAASFELVGQRLEGATSSLEEMAAFYQSTIADSTRRSAEAANALRSQLDSLAAAGSPERISSKLAEAQRTFESLAELNPLWPRWSRPPTRKDR